LANLRDITTISIMKLAIHLMLLLAIFGTITVSCPLPLNDIRYAENATLLTEAMAEIQLRLTDPQMGGINAVGSGSPIERWSYSADFKTHIPVCFRNSVTRIAVKGSFWYLEPRY
jgi:hypothetical protein